MGAKNVFVEKENHVHEKGVLMELKILHPFYLSSHDLVVDHLNNVGYEVIPHVCMDILDIQCHDVHPTLCISSAIHSQHQIQPIYYVLKIWLEIFHWHGGG